MTGLFVTGTDTGVGKSVVCGHLSGYLQREGWKVATQKWVETGASGRSEDLRTHDLLSSGSAGGLDAGQTLRCPYCLSFSSSPHLAAAREGVAIDPDRIERAYRSLCDEFDLVIVEGAGGLLVPLSETLLLADLVKRLCLPALVVVHNRLGCINHALLTLEALKNRGIAVVGIVFNRLAAGETEEIAENNPLIIASISGAPVLGELPFLADVAGGSRAFEHVGRAFVSRWRRMYGNE
jgi:dethiobiotin synthetase